MSAAPHAPPTSLGELHAWQRFHLRISGLYGAVAALVLGVVLVLLYHFGTSAALESVQARLRIAAAAVATGVRPDDVDTLAADPMSPATEDLRAALLARAKALTTADRNLTSIYVLMKVPGGAPGALRFAIDLDSSGRAVAPGTPYDADTLPSMMAGLEALTVEDEPVRDAFGTSLSAYAPLRGSDGRARGLVGIDADASRLDATRRRVFALFAALMALTALLLVPLALVVGRSVRDPIERVIHATARIAGGGFDTRLDVRRSDEFGLLARHFDVMAAGLEERERMRATFGRYFGKRVAAALLERGAAALGGEEREVTVLFSDLQGYSTLSERLPAADVVTLLNRYLAAMTEVVDAHDGVFLEFLGDGFLAVFGTPNALPDHRARATRCALAMRERMVALNTAWDAMGASRLWKRHGVEALTARVGLHAGVVVAGTIGSPEQMKYTVVGDAVNVAARLEALNKDLGTFILASKAVVDGLPPELRARATPLGEQPVRGREGRVSVFSL